jgi:serine protease
MPARAGGPGGACCPSPTAAAGDLRYRTANGRIQTNPGVYVVFWGPHWQSGFTDSGGYTNTQAMTYLDDFLAGIGGTSWNGSQTQYCEGPAVPVGTTDCTGLATTGTVGNPAGMLKGTWVDPSAVPAFPRVGVSRCVNAAPTSFSQICPFGLLPVPLPIDPSNLADNSDAAISGEASRAVDHFGWDPDGNYVVVLGPGDDPQDFGHVWCAYHSESTSSSASGGHPFSYTAQPYEPDAGSGCGQNYVNAANNAYGNGWFDGFSIVLGHEVAETETDPLYQSATGWRDANGGETGDKCAWISPGSPGGMYDLTLGAHSYAVQTLWSNAAFDGTGQGCV